MTFWTLCAGFACTIRPRPAGLGGAQTRSWRVKGFRKYLIFYESLPDRVRLLRVLHGARDLQAEMGK